MKLKTLFSVIACAIFPSCLILEKPDVSKIDTTGVMYHKWSKGWLVNTETRQVAVTCTHSNPTKGTEVLFEDRAGNKIPRKIVETFPIYLSIKNGDPVKTDFSGNLFEHFYAGDITIVVLDSSLPRTITAYNPAYNTKDKQWVVLFNQSKELIPAKIIVKKANIIGTTTTYQKKLKPGDSGLPWFNSKNEIVSHTISGEIGYGTIYGHSDVRDYVDWFIQIAEDYAKSLDKK